MRLQSHEQSQSLEAIVHTREQKDREEHVYAMVRKTKWPGAATVDMDVCGYDDVYLDVARNMASNIWETMGLPRTSIGVPPKIVS